MGYDQNRDRRSYKVTQNDFGGGADTTLKVVGPAGKKGIVAGVYIDRVTETFVGTTTGGKVMVGLSGDTNAYFESDHTVMRGSAPAVGTPINLADTLTGYNEIPADTTVFITCVATVGGLVTGIADATVVIDWY